MTKGTKRLVPSLEETSNAIVAVAKSLSWKSIVIITSGENIHFFYANTTIINVHININNIHNKLVPSILQR